MKLIKLSETDYMNPEHIHWIRKNVLTTGWYVSFGTTGINITEDEFKKLIKEIK